MTVEERGKKREEKVRSRGRLKEERPRKWRE